MLNEARGRLRRRRPMVDIDRFDRAQEGAQVIPFPTSPGASLAGAFPFLGPRCQRITDAVLARLEDEGWLAPS